MSKRRSTTSSHSQIYCQSPQTQQDTSSLLEWLKTQIGKKMRVSFLIGTNMLQDREGTLLEVGTDYILLRETETGDTTACDTQNIKFVTVYR